MLDYIKENSREAELADAKQKQQRTEDRVDQSEQWLQMLIDTAEDYAIFAVNTEGKISTWNKGAEKLFGYTGPEALKQSFEIIFTPEDRKAGVPNQEIEGALRHGFSPDERWHLRKDGSRIFISGAVRPLRDRARNVRGFLKVAHDITAQREAQEQLRQSEERCRLLVESVKDFALFAFDLEGRITDWNPGAQRLFGYAQEEILGQPVDVLYTPEDRSAGEPAHDRELTLREGAQVADRWQVRKDGSRGFFTQAIRPIADENGVVRGFTKVAREITERKKLETHLRHVQEHLESIVTERTARLREAFNELETFSYSMSHDLRAPLRAIRSFSELLRRQLGERLGTEEAELFENIIKASARMDQLIQDVLTFSRVTRERVRLEPVDLDVLLRHIVQENPALQQPAADIAIAHPLLSVLGHESSLSQCLSNLLLNAVKFVAPGVHPKVRVWTEPLDHQVKLWVQDNGIGIAPEYQARIFGMFQRLHTNDEYPGTGIGLAIAKKAVERMGGQIGIESTAGQGSRFWIQLPRGESL